MDMHDAQQNHIEQSSIFEATNMRAYRPMAEICVKNLTEKITIEYMNDTGWSDDTLIYWRNAERIVSLAVSGRADGYFNTPYPPLSELVKALFE